MEEGITWNPCPPRTFHPDSVDIVFSPLHKRCNSQPAAWREKSEVRVRSMRALDAVPAPRPPSKGGTNRAEAADADKVSVRRVTTYADFNCFLQAASCRHWYYPGLSSR